MLELESKTQLRKILDNNRICTLFQPLISLKRRGVFGVEALSRGIDPDTGAIIPPAVLFRTAKQHHLLLELDRTCRRMAFMAFAPIHARDKSMIMSVNIDASVIDETVVRSQTLLRQLKIAGVNPNNVIIEIIESKSRNPDALMEFVRYYKKHGFIIALDDVGAGYSNLDRIPLLKPDILKLDRSLISDIHNQFHKQEVVRSFVRMSRRIGSLILAEGVENKAEIMKLMEIGVDLFQGFHFSHPVLADDNIHQAKSKIEEIASRFKSKAMKDITVETSRVSACDALVSNLIRILSTISFREINQELTSHIDLNSDLECAYILNREGIQVSDTICNPHKLKKSKRFIYEPAQIGEDHSLKEYYLPIRAGMNCFKSRPYISLASGNLCITISNSFNSSTGRKLILCLDINCANSGLFQNRNDN